MSQLYFYSLTEKNTWLSRIHKIEFSPQRCNLSGHLLLSQQNITCSHLQHVEFTVGKQTESVNAALKSQNKHVAVKPHVNLYLCTVMFFFVICSLLSNVFTSFLRCVFT